MLTVPQLRDAFIDRYGYNEALAQTSKVQDIIRKARTRAPLNKQLDVALNMLHDATVKFGNGLQR